MKRVAIVQARMTSTRLPGKVLMDLAGRPMLVQELRRLKRCRRVDEIVVATTTNEADDPLVALAEAEQVRWFRGSEQDVLSRYVGAAVEAKAEIVVRVTADCPLLQPEQSDIVIQELEDHAAEADYCSNVIERTFPRGLDTEALFMDTLLRVDRMAHSTAAREHVTHFILRERADLFSVRSVRDGQDNSDLRWTVDEATDLEMVRRLYREMGLDRRVAGYRETLDYVRANRAISAVNARVHQKGEADRG